MLVRPMTTDDRAARAAIVARAAALGEAGTCPTCRNLETGEVYPPAADRTFFEDDLAWCFLEAYPRNPGHTIVLVKPHYEDIAEAPPEVLQQLAPVLQAATAALKDALGAEKIYLCTMCDGKRNHLHLQLIPRLPGDVTGSRLFVDERGVLADCADVVEPLRTAMRRLMATEHD